MTEPFWDDFSPKYAKSLSTTVYVFRSGLTRNLAQEPSVEDAFHVSKQAVFSVPRVIAVQQCGDSQPLAEAKNDRGFGGSKISRPRI